MRTRKESQKLCPACTRLTVRLYLHVEPSAFAIVLVEREISKEVEIGS